MIRLLLVAWVWHEIIAEPKPGERRL